MQQSMKIKKLGRKTLEEAARLATLGTEKIARRIDQIIIGSFHALGISVTHRRFDCRHTVTIGIWAHMKCLDLVLDGR